jgi:NADH:ubiquinone oxidoreductase subunit K
VRWRWFGKGDGLSLESVLIVAAIIFAIGLYGALSKRHVITVLMCVELMFNAVNITAVALSRYIVPASLSDGPVAATDDLAQFLLTGQIFSVFIITVAAAEVALALAIVIAIYRNRQSVFVTDINLMKQ